MRREPLVDGHGRLIEDLRVSVTDLCNFRCHYCLVPDGIEWLPRDEILTFEEIARVVQTLVGLGIRDVRLTGGEPLVRKGFPDLAARVAAIPGIRDLSVTTNGVLLQRDARSLVSAGIRRFNVSLDALSRDRFAEVTGRDALARVMSGLSELAGTPGVGTIASALWSVSPPGSPLNSSPTSGEKAPPKVGWPEGARRTPSGRSTRTTQPIRPW